MASNNSSASNTLRSSYTYTTQQILSNGEPFVISNNQRNLTTPLTGPNVNSSSSLKPMTKQTLTAIPITNKNTPQQQQQTIPSLGSIVNFKIEKSNESDSPSATLANLSEEFNSTSATQSVSIKALHPSSNRPNAHLTPIVNSSSNNLQLLNSSTSTNLNPRRLSKPLALPNNVSSSSISNGLNAHSISNLGINNLQTQSSNPIISPLKQVSTVPFFNSKKYANEYKQGVRFDFLDPFAACTQEFLVRISEMHRLQLETIDSEKKKKLTKKKSKTNSTSSNALNAASNSGGD